MPDIPISQSTYKRLQRHAAPFEDTPDAVVNRALDALENCKLPSVSGNDPDASARAIDSRNLPSLKHTKVLAASVNGEDLVRPNWNLVMERLVVRAMNKLGNFDELRRRCPVNMVRGRKEDEGYHHLAEIDVSVQRRSANDIGRALAVGAPGLGIEVEVILAWRAKEDAAYPGEMGRLLLPAERDGGRRMSTLDDF